MVQSSLPPTSPDTMYTKPSYTVPDCLDPSTFLQFEVKTLSKAKVMQFQDVIKNYCALSSIVMMMLIYNSVNEVDKLT